MLLKTHTQTSSKLVNTHHIYGILQYVQFMDLKETVRAYLSEKRM